MSQIATSDDRQEPRQDVLHRTRAMLATGEVRSLTVVNISPRGLMARTDDPHAPGDRLSVQLPGVGAVEADVRWALGGRIGCRLDRVIGLADYHTLLQMLMRGL